MPEQDEVSLIEVISLFLKSNAGEHRGDNQSAQRVTTYSSAWYKGPGTIKLLQAQVLLLTFA